MNNTANDEAIARALAHEEQARADAAAASAASSNRNATNANSFGIGIPPAPASRRAGPAAVLGTPVPAPDPVVTCPGFHDLSEFLVSYSQRVTCKLCHRTLSHNDRAYGCVVCQWDTCANCATRPPPSYVPPARSAGNANANQRYPFGPVPPRRNQTHMCLAPCVLGDGMCVEMMVDSGAQSSVISITLAQQLGLVNRIDRSWRGVASGVGKANIIGRISNVICTLGAGHVEFNMDFIVLDVNERILLLGLDLMRRYKCILDLERDVLIFGGSGGVEVPLLPADEQHVNLRNALGDGCTVS
mmetsp:Transcript_18848/g.54332  ORF Transcript_18848/g.54332 Transcript_18848/m.54332 type:complete len:301 (+) Transcript_18848:139-1041(+)